MANKAQVDLNLKLRLEAQLRPKITSYNKELVSEVADLYSKSGNVFDISLLDEQLRQILLNHYQLTARTFDKRLTTRLPQDVEPTERELEEITQALSNFFFFESLRHASLINTTTEEDALEVAEAIESDNDLNRLTLVEKSVLVGAGLSRKLNARTSTILTTETQLAAEAAKSTEAEVLAGLTPTLSGGDNRQTDINKEWVTVGDSRVRDDHVFADSQRVRANDNFVVGGELLRWPGDMSQGASLGNVMNCRCAAVYDDGRIVAERRRRGAQSVTIDTGFSEQLAESFG